MSRTVPDRAARNRPDRSRDKRARNRSEPGIHGAILGNGLPGSQG